MLRIIKILLIASIALWALLGAIGNITGWAGTMGAVGAATSMATFDGGSEDWRATTNPAVILAGALFILTLKILAGGLCVLGAWRMWLARLADAQDFQRAKTLAMAGCGVAMFMLFTGWIVVAETWFEAWRSDPLRDQALQTAFRYCGMIGVMAIFVGPRDD